MMAECDLGIRWVYAPLNGGAPLSGAPWNLPTLLDNQQQDPMMK